MLVLSVSIITVIKPSACHRLPYSISSLVPLRKPSLRGAAPAGTRAVRMGHVSATGLVLPISMWLEHQDGTVCGTGLAGVLRFKQAFPPSLYWYMN